MLPTLINTATVIAGCLLGRLAGNRLPERLQQTLLWALGLVTVGLGVLDLLKAGNTLVVMGSFVAGGLVGELLRIEQGIEWLGGWAQRRWAKESPDNFAGAFVTTSLLFCVGPLTVLGCFEAGLRHDYTKLLVKSAMDAVSSTIFSAALGWGVLLSALTVLVVQSTLTLCAGLLRPLLTTTMITEMTATGGLILIGLGINLLGLAKIRVASFLPSLLIAALAASRWG